MNRIQKQFIVLACLFIVSNQVSAAWYSETYPASNCQLETPFTLGGAQQYSLFDGQLRNSSTNSFWVVCPITNDPTKNIDSVRLHFAGVTGTRTCWLSANNFDGSTNYSSATGTDSVSLTMPSGAFYNAICELQPNEKLLGYNKVYQAD